MLIGADDEGITPLLRDLNRHQLGGEEAARLSGGVALLTAQREMVLRLATDAKLCSDVLTRLGHRINPILALHARIDKAPADRRVVDLCIATEGRVGLGHDERRT